MNIRNFRTVKNSYVLLRNNQESASLSLEDLQQIGLLTTDLVWVECQSVGWRSPLEIKELKPLVSEKKVIEPSTISQVKPSEIASLTNIGKQTESNEWPVKAVVGNEPARQKSLNQAGKDFIYNYSKPDTVVKPTEEKKVIDLKTKYTLPSDEAGETYTKNYLQKEESKNNKKGVILPANFKKILTYAAFVLSGALITLLINNIGGKGTAVKEQSKQPQQQVNIPIEKASSQFTDSNMTALTDEQLNQPADDIMTTTTNQTKIPVAKNKKTNDNILAEKDQNEGLKNNTNQINTPPVIKPDVPKKIPVANIASNLSLKANDYKVGIFGGIRDLEMSVKNNSEILLDRVTVEIRYLNNDGKILNTENIYFNSLHPGEAATMPVQKSKRGVKVEYKISKIESKEIANDNSQATPQKDYSNN